MMWEVLFDILFLDDFDKCEEQDFLLKILPACDSMIFLRKRKYLFGRRKASCNRADAICSICAKNRIKYRIRNQEFYCCLI